MPESDEFDLSANELATDVATSNPTERPRTAAVSRDTTSGRRRSATSATKKIIKQHNRSPVSRNGTKPSRKGFENDFDSEELDEAETVATNREQNVDIGVAIDKTVAERKSSSAKLSKSSLGDKYSGKRRSSGVSSGHKSPTSNRKMASIRPRSSSKPNNDDRDFTPEPDLVVTSNLEDAEMLSMHPLMTSSSVEEMDAVGNDVTVNVRNSYKQSQSPSPEHFRRSGHVSVPVTSPKHSTTTTTKLIVIGSEDDGSIYQISSEVSTKLNVRPSTAAAARTKPRSRSAVKSHSQDEVETAVDRLEGSSVKGNAATVRQTGNDLHCAVEVGGELVSEAEDLPQTVKLPGSRRRGSGSAAQRKRKRPVTAAGKRRNSTGNVDVVQSVSNPAGETGNAQFQLDSTDKPEVKHWLRKKNKLLRKKVVEERRLERQRKRLEEEQKRQQELKKQESKLKVNEWMKEKRLEAKLLAQRQNQTRDSVVVPASTAATVSGTISGLQPVGKISAAIKSTLERTESSENPIEVVVTSRSNQPSACPGTPTESSALGETSAPPATLQTLQIDAATAASKGSAPSTRPSSSLRGIGKGAVSPRQSVSPSRVCFPHDDQFPVSSSADPMATGSASRLVSKSTTMATSASLTYDAWLDRKRAQDAARQAENRRREEIRRRLAATSDPAMEAVVRAVAQRRIAAVVDRKRRIDTGLPRRSNSPQQARHPRSTSSRGGRSTVDFMDRIERSLSVVGFTSSSPAADSATAENGPDEAWLPENAYGQSETLASANTTDESRAISRKDNAAGTGKKLLPATNDATLTVEGQPEVQRDGDISEKNNNVRSSSSSFEDVRTRPWSAFPTRSLIRKRVPTPIVSGGEDRCISGSLGLRSRSQSSMTVAVHSLVSPSVSLTPTVTRLHAVAPRPSLSFDRSRVSHVTAPTNQRRAWNDFADYVWDSVNEVAGSEMTPNGRRPEPIGQSADVEVERMSQKTKSRDFSAERPRAVDSKESNGKAVTDSAETTPRKTSPTQDKLAESKSGKSIAWAENSTPEMISTSANNVRNRPRTAKSRDVVDDTPFRCSLKPQSPLRRPKSARVGKRFISGAADADEMSSFIRGSGDDTCEGNSDSHRKSVVILPGDNATKDVAETTHEMTSSETENKIENVSAATGAGTTCDDEAMKFPEADEVNDIDVTFDRCVQPTQSSVFVDSGDVADDDSDTHDALFGRSRRHDFSNDENASIGRKDLFVNDDVISVASIKSACSNSSNRED